MRRLSLLASMLVGICLLAPFASAQRLLGSISLVPYDFEPLDSAFCDGRLLSISQNTALFSLIGTFYGGDGMTTFALPDLRGRMAVHTGEGSGLSPYAIGQKGGTESVTLTVGQLPAHTHQAVASASPGNTVNPFNATWAPGPRLLLYSSATNLVPMSPGAVGSSGGGEPHENRKPYLVLNYVIWLSGVYPSRN